jgi:hypothetical protein
VRQKSGGGDEPPDAERWLDQRLADEAQQQEEEREDAVPEPEYAQPILEELTSWLEARRARRQRDPDA